MKLELTYTKQQKARLANKKSGSARLALELDINQSKVGEFPYFAFFM
jgi:hypothetical protein